MKASLLVEDREGGWLFLDPTKAAEGSQPVEIKLDDVPFMDIENEELTAWLISDDNKTIRVVPRSRVVWDAPDFGVGVGWSPVPTSTVVMDIDDITYKEVQ